MPLKTLRIDNGRKYTFDEFEEYYRRHDIHHEKMKPGKPQHNGYAKQMNRTIMDKVRLILRMSKLPNAF